MDTLNDASELFNANLERVVKNTPYPYVYVVFKDADVFIYPQWSSRRRYVQSDLYTNLPVEDVLNACDDGDFDQLAHRVKNSIEFRHFLHTINYGEVLWQNVN